MKIYYKLNLLIIFLLVILTLIIKASVNVRMSDELEQEMLERELIIAEYVTEDLANPLLQKDAIAVNEIIDNVMIRNTDIRYIYVVDFDGVVITHTFSQDFPADMVTANLIPPNENTAVKVFSVEGESIQDVGVRVLNGMDAKQAEEEIRKLNTELEQRVTKRTAELEDKNAELERMNKLFVGREIRMIELKKQIAKLEKDIEPDKKAGDKTT